MCFTVSRSLEAMKDCPMFGWASDYEQQEVKLTKIMGVLEKLEDTLGIEKNYTTITTS